MILSSDGLPFERQEYTHHIFLFLALPGHPLTLAAVFRFSTHSCLFVHAWSESGQSKGSIVHVNGLRCLSIFDQMFFKY